LESDVISRIHLKPTEPSAYGTREPQLTRYVKKEQSSLPKAVALAAVLPQTAPFPNANGLSNMGSANGMVHHKSYAHAFCNFSRALQALDTNYLTGEDQSGLSS